MQWGVTLPIHNILFADPADMIAVNGEKDGSRKHRSSQAPDPGPTVFRSSLNAISRRGQDRQTV